MDQDALEVLVFFSGESCYGIDIEQIAYLADPSPTQEAVSFEELMRSNVSQQEGRRKRISVKGHEEILVLIPEPETVSNLSLRDIRPLPAVFKAAQPLGVWGLAQKEGRLIILLDLYKNLQFKELVRQAQ
ncbi:hypothetical protein [Azotosporobacter soli]|uniref:hypothetical protein n=1 Tax=Azotosporobacter soli TaxID=3055040 RepID=UPI0031FF4074